MNWVQLQTLFWLRWRLTRNQWRRGGAFNSIVMLIGAVLGTALGLLGGIAALLVGVLALSKAPPQVLLLVWDGLVGAFLLVWVIGLLSEIQRSETIDFARLLHLPVSLRQVFLLNYLASHLTLGLVLFLPAMLGLAVGLALGVTWRMALLIPLALSLVFMVTAWTYCLRGWLIALMSNQRRRRTVITVVTMSIVFLVQLPNIYFNVMRRSGPHRQARSESLNADVSGIPPHFLLAHRFVPPLWPGQAALDLAGATLWTAPVFTAGDLILGSLGLGWAYRSTLRFYRGAKGGRSKARSTRTAPESATGTGLLERQVPLLPAEATALALAMFRSLTRAPEIKMALGSNVLAVLVLGAVFISQGRAHLGPTGQLFVGFGVMAFPFLGLAQMMFNQFGPDREGFRTLVLLPTPRKYILLGKNLAFLPLIFSIAIGLLFLAALFVRLAWPLILAAFLQFTVLFLLLSMAGNLVSMLAPYRIGIGSLKPTKAPAKKMLLILLWQLVFPIVMVPALLPAALGLLSERYGWLPGKWVALAFSLLAASLAFLLYWSSLGPLGRLLQGREKKVLEAVTQTVE